RETNYDTLLANAIRLYRHVVFDESHSPYNTILADFSDFADDLVNEGFAVSSMGDFSPAFFGAAEILVLTTGTTTYTSAEADAIEAFVQDGGGLFVATDYGSFGDELDQVTERFGFIRNKTAYLTDTDDTIAGDSYNVYDGANIANHSITLDVSRLELDRPGGFTDLPSNAVTLVSTDTDGTSDWHTGQPADGVPIAAAVTTVGDGRVAVVCDMNFMDDSTNPDADGETTYSDSDNDVFLINNIRWLSAAGLKERIVLFDESHNPFFSVNSGYLDFGNYLTLNGYTLQWMTTFYASLLETAHVLFICDGTVDYTTSEITAIVDFVAAGGGLFLIGDLSTYHDKIDPIANEFGMDYNDTGYLEDSDDHDPVGEAYILYNESNFGAHPIMEGISRIEVDLGTAFDSIGTGTALVTTDTDGTCSWSDGGLANGLAVFAAQEHELGRVVAVSDVQLVHSGYDADSDGIPQLYEHDNILFTLNSFQWLVENRAPVVEVTAPNGGEELSGTTSITWTATDPNKDEFTVDISYSTNGGSSWTVLTTGLTTMSWSWDTSTTPDSDQYLIRVEATDYELTGQDVSDAVFQVDNYGPTITNVKHGPAAPTAADTVNVSANVEDISGVKDVTCYYTVNSGTEQSVALSLVSGTLYAVDFPTNFAVNDVVEYYIKAVDNNDFATSSSTKSFTVAAPPGIPGFELPVVALGLLVSLGILLVVRRKRR
ncbi:MAG: hypothetical protein ACFFCZ_28285, partial [Promethearchaeota archaeon]